CFCFRKDTIFFEHLKAIGAKKMMELPTDQRTYIVILRTIVLMCSEKNVLLHCERTCFGTTE
ncbi:MAG: hypothetical protein J6W02_05320, partial [Bacteroidaceae bacterium]|nr:hypothetical protein [Bacteroidaceae bacterium]